MFILKFNLLIEPCVSQFHRSGNKISFNLASDFGYIPEQILQEISLAYLSVFTETSTNPPKIGAMIEFQLINMALMVPSSTSQH